MNIPARGTLSHPSLQFPANTHVLAVASQSGEQSGLFEVPNNSMISPKSPCTVSVSYNAHIHMERQQILT